MNSLRLSELSLDELETHRTDIEQESNALVEKIIREQGVSPLKEDTTISPVKLKDYIQSISDIVPFDGHLGGEFDRTGKCRRSSATRS